MRLPYSLKIVVREPGRFLPAVLAVTFSAVLVTMQAGSDADYFLHVAGRPFAAAEQAAIRETFRRAYRGQYIASGVQDKRFNEILGAMITKAQAQRIGEALAPILA